MIARLTAQPACDYDADRAEDLPNASPDHPDYDANYPDGYETPSTGFLQVGARDYDPDLGRWLQPDPIPAGAELQWGQNNRWEYCANDPVNASDPSGRVGMHEVAFGVGMTVGLAFGVYYGWTLGASGKMASFVEALLGAIASLLAIAVGGLAMDGCLNRNPQLFAILSAALGGLTLSALGPIALSFLAGLGLGLLLGFNVGVSFGSMWNIISTRLASADGGEIAEDRFAMSAHQLAGFHFVVSLTGRSERGGGPVKLAPLCLEEQTCHGV